jgi:hypothetical protein
VKLLVAALVLALAGCPAVPPEPPHVEIADGGYPTAHADSSDAEDPPVELATFPICAKACATLKRLGCPEAARPDGGRTCYAVCAEAEKGGHFSLRPSCVAPAVSVEELRACKTVRCGGK